MLADDSFGRPLRVSDCDLLGSDEVCAVCLESDVRATLVNLIIGGCDDGIDFDRSVLPLVVSDDDFCTVSVASVRCA